jgi:diaminopropionate ammonia-lyase family
MPSATASIYRRLVHLNQHSRAAGIVPRGDALTDVPRDVLDFHKQLPGYSPSSLVALEALAVEFGVRSVYVKYEGNRLGLPSFKILGASWATFRALVRRLGLPLNSTIGSVKSAASSASIKLIAATDGNHGRAVAHMAAIFGLPSLILVPVGLDDATVAFIKGEGAAVRVIDGSYDLAVVEAAETAERSPDYILVQDTAFLGYEDIPDVRLSPRADLTLLIPFMEQC